MATKNELYDHLQNMRHENHVLTKKVEAYEKVLRTFYTQIRGVLGIEAAAQDREEARVKLLGEKDMEVTDFLRNLPLNKTAILIRGGDPLEKTEVVKEGEDTFRLNNELPTSYPNTVRLLRKLGFDTIPHPIRITLDR